MKQEDPADLTAARAEIDAIDQQLVSLLALRQRTVKQVIAIKKREGIPALIPARVDEVLANAEAAALKAGLSPELARRLWTEMVNWFVRHEEGELQE